MFASLQGIFFFLSLHFASAHISSLVYLALVTCKGLVQHLIKHVKSFPCFCNTVKPWLEPDLKWWDFASVSICQRGYMPDLPFPYLLTRRFTLVHFWYLSLKMNSSPLARSSDTESTLLSDFNWRDTKISLCECSVLPSACKCTSLLWHNAQWLLWVECGARGF